MKRRLFNAQRARGHQASSKAGQCEGHARGRSPEGLRMGWLPPWCPNFSLKVVPPTAWPRTWWPMQMPNIGRCPRSFFTFSTAYGTADGSPCQRNKKQL
jgi:hypothetical protein